MTHLSLVKPAERPPQRSGASVCPTWRMAKPVFSSAAGPPGASRACTAASGWPAAASLRTSCVHLPFGKLNPCCTSTMSMQQRHQALAGIKFPVKMQLSSWPMHQL